MIQFSKSVFDSFASVLAHATQVGQDIVISADAGDSVTLKNTKLTAINSHDFHFSYRLNPVAHSGCVFALLPATAARKLAIAVVVGGLR